jgi:hypothetical protein
LGIEGVRKERGWTQVGGLCELAHLKTVTSLGEVRDGKRLCREGSCFV